MTIAQTLKFAVEKLNSKNISSPQLEAEILLAKVLKKSREFILAHGEENLTKAQTVSYKLKIKTRLTGLPLAYLTGEKEFYGLNFKVNKNVLIPRPETELMVEAALKLTARSSQPITFIDVGTGSGCIIITLTKQITNYELKITNYKFLATDISTKALTIAKQNSIKHGVNKKIKFLHGNLLKPLINNTKYQIQNTKFIIVANLPYGWKEWKNNSSAATIGLKFEPPIALYAHKDGLELYEKLFQQINYLIHNTKYKIHYTLYILCEFDPRQTAKIKRLIKRELPPAIIQIKKDLAGLNRLAVIKIRPSEKYRHSREGGNPEKIFS